MSGIIARVLVVLFGLSFGCGLIREMISRHRRVRIARRHLGTIDSNRSHPSFDLSASIAAGARVTKNGAPRC